VHRAQPARKIGKFDGATRAGPVMPDAGQMPQPEVSIVIPYYDDQPRLTLLLRALDQQACDERFDVVIADDGSPEPPVVPNGLGVDCTVVRQADEGFRAAAARNLGAASAAGGLLLFLDGDTLPAAGYVAAMCRTLRAIDDGHGTLVVGRRRHADLGEAHDAERLAFLRALPQDAAAEVPPVAGAIRLLGDPQWLLDGYRRTDNLRSATDEDFRLVISAVLGMDRRLWEATGGFDEDFVGYGGEDWDFGWRAWLAGGQFAYEPAAVAWHDGPDAAGRKLDPTVKNAECLRLAQTVALPSVRGTGLILHQPEIVISYLGPTTGTAADAAVVACIAGLLDGADAAVWFPRCADSAAMTDLPPLLRGDPRIHAGEVPRTVLVRARYQVRVHRPVRLLMSLPDCCSLGEWDVPGSLRIRRTRSMHRGEPPPAGVPTAAGPETQAVQLIPADVSLERWWAGW
jgi:GT2 family glycosyltransferase